MERSHVLKDVPQEKVDDVRADFKSEGLRDITVVRQPNGLWTIVAKSAEPDANRANR